LNYRPIYIEMLVKDECFNKPRPSESRPPDCSGIRWVERCDRSRQTKGLQLYQISNEISTSCNFVPNCRYNCIYQKSIRGKCDTLKKMQHMSLSYIYTKIGFLDNENEHNLTSAISFYSACESNGFY